MLFAACILSILDHLKKNTILCFANLDKQQVPVSEFRVVSLEIRSADDLFIPFAMKYINHFLKALSGWGRSCECLSQDLVFDLNTDY